MFVPVVMFVSGGRALRFGSSVIWTLSDKKQAILDGIQCLRTRDPELFLQFTRQKLYVVPAGNTRMANIGGRDYGLHNRYIELGPEGVASFIVMAVFFSEASPSFNQHRLTASELAALKTAPRKLTEWMQQHAFHPGLINSYQKVALNWERRERFKKIAN
jgi:hypothetical protein